MTQHCPYRFLLLLEVISQKKKNGNKKKGKRGKHTTINKQQDRHPHQTKQLLSRSGISYIGLRLPKRVRSIRESSRLWEFSLEEKKEKWRKKGLDIAMHTSRKTYNSIAADFFAHTQCSDVSSSLQGPIGFLDHVVAAHTSTQFTGSDTAMRA
jgi:hypothetical protein